jgi:hypothetical protein
VLFLIDLRCLLLSFYLSVIVCLGERLSSLLMRLTLSRIDNFEPKLGKVYEFAVLWAIR